MTENFQPSEDIFEDVEGHAAEAGRFLPEDIEKGAKRQDDVEGHLGGKTVPVEADDDNVEGHMSRGKG